MAKKKFDSIDDAITSKNDALTSKKHTPKYADINTSCYDGMPLEEYPPLDVGPSNPGQMPDVIVDQIVACLENTRDQIRNYTPFVPESQFRGKIGITLRNQQFILDAIDYSQKFPDLRPANFSVEEWLNDLANYNIFILIYRLIAGNDRIIANRASAQSSLERLCWRAVRIYATRCFEMFRQYYRFVEGMALAGNLEAQTIYEELKRYFSRLGRPSRANSDNDEVLKEDVKEVQKITKDIRNKVDGYLKLEKDLEKTLQRDIKHQDEILDSK